MRRREVEVANSKNGGMRYQIMRAEGEKGEEGRREWRERSLEVYT